MIAESIGVNPGGMYAVVVAIDWFLDRFRTAVNVSGDLFAADVVRKMAGITDPEGMDTDLDQEVGDIRVETDNSNRV